MTKKFKIINSGVALEFYKAFDDKGKLKKKLFSWYNEVFENTRCEYDKKLGMFKVFYRDFKAELQVLRHFASGDGIELHIFSSGSLTSLSENFIGNEFICYFDGLTQFVHQDFFRIESKTPIQVVQESKEIKAITDYGKNNKTQIESILQEWQNPVPPQFLGGAEK